MLSVLFVCGKNRRRSPTAEQVFAGHPGVVTASAGVDRDADQPLTLDAVRAADLIVVMEPVHRVKLQRACRAALNGQRVVCLNVPDDFEYMQPELVERLQRAVLPLLRQGPKAGPARVATVRPVRPFRRRAG